MRLIVQTSSAGFGLGLLDDEGVVLREVRGAGKDAVSRDIGAMFRSLFDGTDKARPDLASIDGILVDLGPGGLSSTRAGVSFANGLAFGASIPLFGVSALDLLAVHARETWSGPLLCMRPAQGGLAYWIFCDGNLTAAAGCDRPEVALAQVNAGEAALIGPLARLRLDGPAFSAVRLMDVDPPDMRHFARVPLRAPVLRDGVAVLGPITSAAGLSSGTTAPRSGSESA